VLFALGEFPSSRFDPPGEGYDLFRSAKVVSVRMTGRKGGISVSIRIIDPPGATGTTRTLVSIAPPGIYETIDKIDMIVRHHPGVTQLTTQLRGTIAPTVKAAGCRKLYALSNVIDKLGTDVISGIIGTHGIAL
jgi:hypothetical protein